MGQDIWHQHFQRLCSPFLYIIAVISSIRTIGRGPDEEKGHTATINSLKAMLKISFEVI